MMPKNLIFIRHGQSEANVMQQADKSGDASLYTEQRVTVPDRSWRLTAAGVEQAAAAGEYVKSLKLNLNRFMVSPYIRTRETAAMLGLENAAWEETRALRERSWGEISSIPLSKFREEYPYSAALKEVDPLYWAPPGGTSVAAVAEDRVRNLLSTLHRESSEESVLAVAHGELMWASRLVLEYWSDEEFLERHESSEEKIHNCTVLQYTRQNPSDPTEPLAEKLRWVRRAWPVKNSAGGWEMAESSWEEFSRPSFTNEELLARAHSQALRL